MIVALYEGSKSWKKAEAAGLTVMTTAEAAKVADMIMILINDEEAGGDVPQGHRAVSAPRHDPRVCARLQHPLRLHQAAEGYRRGDDRAEGPGHTVRSQYLEGKGRADLVAVYQDASGKGAGLRAGVCGGIGGARAGILKTTFREETETDLFGEQAVLCGGVTALMQAGFETLVEAGYDPRNAYFECIHEMKLIVDLIFAHGFAGMRYSISNTAEYGDYEIGQRLITEETKKEMKKVLTEIQDGTFARNWLLENQSGCVHFLAKRRIEAGSQLEEVGKDLRSKMSWGTKVEEL